MTDHDVDTPAALFEPSGSDGWMATELARGPWDPRHCHGGPVGALLARAVEHADHTDHTADTGVATTRWQIARLTVELTRPVPVGVRLSLTTEVERPGRKVSLVAVVLSDGNAEVARARSLRIRTVDVELPPGTVQPAADPPGLPGEGRTIRSLWGTEGGIAFHTHACDHRFVEGGWEEPGPVAVWIRITKPVVEGEAPSGVQRAVAAADYGNGVSRGLDAERFLFINPDLTVHLVREPVGEWIGMRAASYYGIDGRSAGVGMAESALYDARGRLGRSVQSLFIDQR